MNRMLYAGIVLAPGLLVVGLVLTGALGTSGAPTTGAAGIAGAAARPCGSDAIIRRADDDLRGGEAITDRAYLPALVQGVARVELAAQRRPGGRLRPVLLLSDGGDGPGVAALVGGARGR